MMCVKIMLLLALVLTDRLLTMLVRVFIWAFADTRRHKEAGQDEG